jgi:hypothetical protein
MLMFPEEYDKDTSSAKSTDSSRQLFRASLLDISTGICQRALVDESGMIRTQTGTHHRSDNGRSACDALYDTTPQQQPVNSESN